MGKKSSAPIKPTPPPKPDTSGWETERRNVESEQRELEAKKAANVERIERLETAKKEFKDILNDVNKVMLKISTKGLVGESVSDFWKGAKYNSYDRFVREDFIANYKKYYDNLDGYRDSIKEKIKQLKNENSSYDSSLSSLSSQWTSLTNQINAALS